MADLLNRGVRKARGVLADIRAAEIEGERANPVAPSHGGAAVPSMGLSEFRGGKKHTLVDHLKHPTKGFGKAAEESDSDEETPKEAGRMLRKHIEEMHGGKYLARFIGGMNTGAYEGEGKLHGGAAPDARMVGGITAGPGFFEASGKVKKARKPVSESDGRRKRGAALSKLMKEKNMSLPEASKYLKEHGY